MSLKPLPLAQFRTLPTINQIKGEEYILKWFRNEKEVPSLNSKFEWQLPIEEGRGTWRGELELKTLDVRKDTRQLLHDALKFQI